MIGDGAGDLEAGRAAGVQTGLVFAPNRCELCPLRGGPSGTAARTYTGPPWLEDLRAAILAPRVSGCVLLEAALGASLMALFIDSSDPKEIKDLFAWGVLSGVTTNPLIIAKEAPDADLGERIREVLAVSWGDVSVELTTETEKRDARGVPPVPRVGPGAHHHQGAVQRDRPPRPSPARRSAASRRT